MQKSKKLKFMVAQPLYMGNLALASYAEPTSAPEGYMTGDEFENSLKAELKQFYIKNGLL